jgi:hypothetical protein
VAQPFRLGPDPRVATHTALSLIRWWQGHVDTSLEHARRSVAGAEELGHPSSIGYALFHVALLRLWREEPEQAREVAARVVNVAEEHDLRIWRAVATVIIGASTVALGLGPDGSRWIAEGLDRYRTLRTPPIFWPFLLKIRATACATTGQVEEGLAAVDEALAVAPMPDLLVAQGDLLHAAGRDAEAATAYDAAAEAASAWGARMLELRARVRGCALVLSDGPPVESRRARVADVVAGFSEGADLPELRAARALGEADQGTDSKFSQR